MSLETEAKSNIPASSGREGVKSKKSASYGALMMILASVCFSPGGLLCKMIPWSPLAINGVRNLLGSLVIGCYLIATGHRPQMNKKVLAGAVCMFGVTTFFAIANKMTTAANTIVLQYTAPIWVMIFMAAYLHKKPDRGDLITMLVVFAGIVCFFVDGLSTGGIAGDLVAIAAGIFYAGLFVLNSIEGSDAISSLFFGQLFAGILLTPLMARESDFSASSIIAVLILGLIQIGLAYVFFYQGTKYTDPVNASLIAGLEPVLNPILVAVFWHERLTALSVTGAVIVIAAVTIHTAFGRHSESRA